MSYPKRAIFFLLIISFAALLTGTTMLMTNQGDFLNWRFIIVFSCLGILSESLAVFLQQGNIYTSTTEAVFFLSFLITGSVGSMIIIFASMILWIDLSAEKPAHIFNTRFRYTLFNISQYIVSLFVISLLYSFLPGELVEGVKLLPAIILSPLFYLISCLLNALFYQCEEGNPFRIYFISTFKKYIISAVLASLFGIMTAMAFPRYGILSTMIFIVPVFLTKSIYNNLSGENN